MGPKTAMATARLRNHVPLLPFLSTVQDLNHTMLSLCTEGVGFRGPILIRRGRLPALPTSLKIEDDDPISLCETVSGIVCDQLL